MKNSGDFDKFDSVVIPYCQRTASQEEKLHSCPFARESEVFSDGIQSSSSLEQATGILMVSLSESSDDYQTPPEQHFPSQKSSNDDHAPTTNTTTMDRDMDVGRVGGGESMTTDDNGEPPGQRMVDLANDSDNLVFWEKGPRVFVEDDNTPMLDRNESHQLEGDCRIVELDPENLVCETTNTVLVSSPKEKAHQVFVEMPKRATKNINTEKRKLPISIKTQEQKQNSGDVFIDSVSRVWKILNGRHDQIEDIDFLETAKCRGLTFPRPRWWSPQDSTCINNSTNHLPSKNSKHIS